MSAIKFFSSFSNVTKRKQFTIDNVVFKLHYRFTTILVLFLSIILWSKQLAEDPIHCSGSIIDKEVLDTYCWIQSTFTIPEVFEPYYGVGKITEHDKKVYHAYYQWVFLFLIFQGVCFYVPYYIWKSAEDGKLEALLLGLNKPIFEDEGIRQKRLQLLAKFLYKTLGQHRSYAFYFYCCESLNVVNTIVQINLTDIFLAGEFSTYGLQVIGFSLGLNQFNQTNPMVQVFPRMTMCTFYRHGISGSIESHDSLCILPLNIINDKIFVFLWFWYILLTVIGIVVIAYRIALLVFKKLRFRATFRKNIFVDRDELDRFIVLADFGSWHLLDLLSKNMSTINFVELLHNFIICMDEFKQEHV